MSIYRISIVRKVNKKLYEQTFPPKPELMVVKQPTTPSNFAEEVLKRNFSVPEKVPVFERCNVNAILPP